MKLAKLRRLARIGLEAPKPRIVLGMDAAAPDSERSVVVVTKRLPSGTVIIDEFAHACALAAEAVTEIFNNVMAKLNAGMDVVIDLGRLVERERNRPRRHRPRRRKRRRRPW